MPDQDPIELPPRVARALDVRERPGYRGMFTTKHAEGAIENGAAIVKVRSEPDDTHRDGAPGVVLGSIRIYRHYLYFIEWLDTPRVAVAIGGHRIRRALTSRG